MQITKLEISQRIKFGELLNSISLFTEEEKSILEELQDVFFHKQNQNDYEFYVSIIDNDFTGFICFGPTPMTKGTYDLYWIGTHDKHQRKGIAKGLINFMREALINRGGRKIRIETSSKDSYEGTLAFYRGLEFKEEGIIKNFYDENDHLIIFTIDLNN